MGLGLAKYIPLISYCLFWIVLFLTLFYKAEIGLFYLIPTFPLCNLWYKFHAFPLGKDFNDILLIAIILNQIFKKKKFEKTPNTLPIIIFIVITYFALWKGCFYLGFPPPISFRDPRFVFWKNYMIMPLVFFLVSNNIKKLKQFKILTILIAFIMILISWKVFQDFRWRSHNIFREDIRPAGPFEACGLCPNHLGAFFAEYSILYLGLFFFDRSLKRRLLFLGVFLASLYPLLFSYSRGAYLAIFVALFYIGILKKRKILLLLIGILICWHVEAWS